MTLFDQLTDYINAAFTGLWIKSFEPDEAEREIVRHARQNKWKVAVWDVASGLTRYESEGAFALSLAKHGKLRLETIWDLKAQTVKKSGLATIYRGGDTFDNLGGMNALKELCRKALRPSCPVAAKGFILLSPPG